MEKEKIQREGVGINPSNDSEILKDSLSSKYTRFFDTDSLHELLCHRYNLSRYADNKKLIDLVKEELSL